MSRALLPPAAAGPWGTMSPTMMLPAWRGCERRARSFSGNSTHTNLRAERPPKANSMVGRAIPGTGTIFQAGRAVGPVSRRRRSWYTRRSARIPGDRFACPLPFAASSVSRARSVGSACAAFCRAVGRWTMSGRLRAACVMPPSYIRRWPAMTLPIPAPAVERRPMSWRDWATT